MAVNAARPTLQVDAKVAAVWGLLCGLAAIAVLPYLMALMPGKFAQVGLPIPLLAALQGVQATVLLGLMAFAGLRMGRRVDLGSPWLQSWLGHGRTGTRRPLDALHAIALGVGAALLVVALSLLLDPLLPRMLHPPAQSPATTSALNGLLASLYGGIAEEVQLRLFVMTLLVWVVAKWRKSTPSPAMYWAAIVLAALLFGAGHLPAAQQVWGLDAIVVLRTVALNAAAGLAFGWLYWKRGLEMAVVAHFSADLVLHVAAPLLHVAP